MWLRRGDGDCECPRCSSGVPSECIGRHVASRFDCMLLLLSSKSSEAPSSVLFILRCPSRRHGVQVRLHDRLARGAVSSLLLITSK